MARIIKIFKSKDEKADILNGCRQNNPRFQKLLFEKYSQVVYTTCRRYNTPYYHAKDLLHDTFIKVFDKINQFDEKKGKLESWITRIAINLALNSIRDKKINFVKLDYDLEEITENSSLQYDLSEEEILAIIDQLPLGYKTVFNLYVFDDFTHKEIATELNISVSTSKSQLFKAKKMLQKQIFDIQKSKYGGL